MKKYLSFLIIIISLVVSFSVFAENVNNSGFVSNQIWYSKDNLVEGDNVKVYTAIWNGNNGDLSVKVEFYDQNVILGVREILIPKESIKEVYVNWKVTSGDHIISAKIISSNLISGNNKENIILKNNQTENNKEFVSAVVKNTNGDNVTSSDLVKDEVKSISSKITEAIPNSINEPLSNSYNAVDDFRDTTLNKIIDEKNQTEKELITKDNQQASSSENSGEIKKFDPIDRPLTYLKFYLLTLFGLIFSHKIIFYGLALLILFYILRYLFRLITKR